MTLGQKLLIAKRDSRVAELIHNRSCRGEITTESLRQDLNLFYLDAYGDGFARGAVTMDRVHATAQARACGRFDDPQDEFDLGIER